MKKRLTRGDNIYYFRMFRYMKPYSFRYVFGQLSYASQGLALPLMLSFFTTNILAAIAAESTSAVVNAGVMLAIVFLGYFAVFAFGVALHIINVERAMMDMKQKLFKTFVRTGLENAKHSGEGIAAINTDCNTAEQIFGNATFSLVRNLLIIPGAIVVVFFVDWRLGLATTTIGILSFIAQLRFVKPLSQIGKDRLIANADTVKSAGNIFSGATTIRAFNIQNDALITFDKDSRKIKILDFKRVTINIFQNIFGNVQGWMTTVTVFALGGWLVTRGILEFPILITVYMMSQSLVSAIGSLGQNIAELQPPIAAAKRVFEVLDKGDTVKEIRSRSTLKEASGYTLELKNMNFKYLDGETNALTDINLTIPENKMIVLVGGSGSGKSTLLKVILGMYDRDELGVTLGGLCFNEASLRDWRKHFSYIDQSCKLFDMSVKENIAMGLPSIDENRETFASSDKDKRLSEADFAEIEKAAKRASAHDFISELEGGYDAGCGEKGATLSGGQKQRIAIARALVKHAPIMIFDEATSALDKESERNILDTIEDLRSDHTILITSHNLDSIKTADVILVMEDGKIAETGTHEELLAKQGVYYRLASQEK